jgi:hypothetical protein
VFLYAFVIAHHPETAGNLFDALGVSNELRKDRIVAFWFLVNAP